MKNGKRMISILLAEVLAFTLGIFVGGEFFGSIPEGNFSDEMKMEYRTDFEDGGANLSEREGDYETSPYFYNMDIYNVDASASLSLLPQFETIQQTSGWSAGVSCVEMVLNYFGQRGDWSEESLAALREDHSLQHEGVCLDQVIGMFEAVGGFELETTYDYQDNLDAVDMAFLRERVRAGIPVIVGWNDRGGHWQVVIGYDTMETEYEGDDVIIVADPFDTSDHNQDGYGVYSAEKMISSFSFYDSFDGAPNHLYEKCFVAVKPAVK